MALARRAIADRASVYDPHLLREILDAQLEMLCRFRRDGTILFVNRAYADTLGRSPAELTGKNLWQFVSAADRADVEARLNQLSPDRPEITIENRFETAAGTRWIMWRNHGLSFGPDGDLLVAQSSGFDITERKQLEEQRQLLIDELNHRVRNTLTVVQGMALQSFRNDAVPRAQLETFTARLHALASAHTVLSNANWTGAGLGGIVAEAMAICGDGSPRIVQSGPDVTVAPGVAVALALVLHELVTNAIKYGALSNADGTLAIEWSVERSQLLVRWTERGGPPVSPPVRRGFGSRLLETTVGGQLGGELAMTYAPAGVECRIVIPLGERVRMRST